MKDENAEVKTNCNENHKCFGGRKYNCYFYSKCVCGPNCEACDYLGIDGCTNIKAWPENVARKLNKQD